MKTSVAADISAVAESVEKRFQKGRPQDLNIKQASQAIDDLKAACAGVAG